MFLLKRNDDPRMAVLAH